MRREGFLKERGKVGPPFVERSGRSARDGRSERASRGGAERGWTWSKRGSDRRVAEADSVQARVSKGGFLGATDRRKVSVTGAGRR